MLTCLVAIPILSVRSIIRMNQAKSHILPRKVVRSCTGLAESSNTRKRKKSFTNLTLKLVPGKAQLSQTLL